MGTSISFIRLGLVGYAARYECVKSVVSRQNYGHGSLLTTMTGYDIVDEQARVVEQGYTPHLGCGAGRHTGSTPVTGTIPLYTLALNSML